MGSFSVKLAVFLLLVTPCLGSLGSLIGNGAKSFLGKGGKLADNQLPRKWPYQLPGNNKPTYNMPINPSFHVPKQSTYFQKLQAMQASAKGKELANKYFGPDGFRKGFRWGRKLHKRYRSVADKCEQFEQTLTSCTPVQKNHDPACVLHCIVVLAENLFDNTLVNSCTKYEDCDYPEEATCNLDQPATLNATCY